MPEPIDHLITRAEAAIALWDLTLFATGQKDARQKRADVVHEAVMNLKAAVDAAKSSRQET